VSKGRFETTAVIELAPYEILEEMDITDLMDAGDEYEIASYFADKASELRAHMHEDEVAEVQTAFGFESSNVFITEVDRNALQFAVTTLRAFAFLNNDLRHASSALNALLSRVPNYPEEEIAEEL
jgi:hypothetical protein